MLANILVIDDDESICQLLRMTLEKNKFSCTTATNAARARELLKIDTFDLILCDIKLPGQSGLAFIQDIMPQYPDMAVLMVTGVDDMRVAKTVLEMGVYGYIVKPFGYLDVMINVVNALRRREIEKENRIQRGSLETALSEQSSAIRRLSEDLKQIRITAQSLESVLPSADSETSSVEDSSWVQNEEPKGALTTESGRNPAPERSLFLDRSQEQKKLAAIRYKAVVKKGWPV
jgi:DNA-binding NtrC family response regulator